jgi:hypothetical protein
MMASPKTQAQQRRDLILADQFNRKWLVCVEIGTGDPTGAITRVGGWLDPLQTPQQFLTVPHDDVTMGQWKVLVDFPAWIEQQEHGEVEWYVELRKQEREAYKRLDPSEVANAENDAYLRERTGPKPWPSSAVLKSAVSGDRQFLGFEPLDNDHRIALGMPIQEAQEIAASAKAKVETPEAGIPAPPDNYQDFVSWAFRYQGVKDYGKAAQMWREHRKLLQEA